MQSVRTTVRRSFERLWFFHVAFVLMWLKTAIAQRFAFDLPISGAFQEFIALVNPVSSLLLFLWLALAIARRQKIRAVLWVSFITSFLLFANAWFYRFFNDFITLPVLFQTSNAGGTAMSALAMLKPWDVLFFADFLILLAVAKFRNPPEPVLRGRGMSAVFALAVAVFLANWAMAESVRPELLTRTFDRNIVVKSIGTYNYHLYDLIVSSKTQTQRAFASSAELADVEKYVSEKPVPAEERKPPADLEGIAAGKNIVLVSMESLQSFVIGNTVFGHEITPFLNELIRESFWFPNFYHQTGQGKTSDAEFIIDNSLYPLPSGAVFFTHATNQYNATPKILKKYGYYAAVFHANDKTFWNRDNMYGNLGYDRYFSKTDYEIREEDTIGWGLKDIPFFEQSVEMLQTIPQPFYAKFITLTNHHPFSLERKDEYVPEFDSGDGTVDRYFTTVRYMDEALKVFFERMKETGLYEDSIFILYGDHYGISANHNDAMALYLGRAITPYEHVQLQRVPLLIHIPGVKGETIERVAGQVDVRPTLLHLLGIEGENPYDFGENLFADHPDPLVVLRDGSFITKDYVYAENTCYLKGIAGFPTDPAFCEPYAERAANDLSYSDKIIYGDLMRFSETLNPAPGAEDRGMPGDAESPEDAEDGGVPVDAGLPAGADDPADAELSGDADAPADAASPEDRGGSEEDAGFAAPSSAPADAETPAMDHDPADAALPAGVYVSLEAEWPADAGLHAGAERPADLEQRGGTGPSLEAAQP